MDHIKINEIFHNEMLNKTILILGYGSIGKCLVEILLDKFPNINLLVIDQIDPPSENSNLKFQYIQLKIERENIESLLKFVKKGDILIELSTYIESLCLWSLCTKNGIAYINTAVMPWGDVKETFKKPKNVEDLYKYSHGSVHDEALSHELWNTKEGATAVFEFGMNPGLISHCVKKGILDAAEYFCSSCAPGGY